jgi:hypothetical protein
MPTCDNARVEGSRAVYQDAKDPWAGGSLDGFQKQWHGTGDFLEDFIEQVLQFGMKEE